VEEKKERRGTDQGGCITINADKAVKLRLLGDKTGREKGSQGKEEGEAAQEGLLKNMASRQWIGRAVMGSIKSRKRKTQYEKDEKGTRKWCWRTTGVV